MSKLKLIKQKASHDSCEAFVGATGGIRTPDRSVRSRVLYPAELQLHKPHKNNITFLLICQ